MHEADLLDGHGTQRRQHGTGPSGTRPSRIQPIELLGRLAADELATDLVVRSGLALKQDDPSASPGEPAGGGSTGKAAPDDGGIPAHVKHPTR